MINWEMMGVNEITNVVKACDSWSIGAIKGISGAELKIIDAAITGKNKGAFTLGTAIADEDKFQVARFNQQYVTINFFYISNTCVPIRYAAFYGLETLQRFTNY